MDRVVLEPTRRELFVHLQKMEPLIMRTQHFLDRVLPGLAAAESNGCVQINKGTRDPFDVLGLKGDPTTGLSRPQAQTLEDMSIQELFNPAWASKETQAKQANDIRDLQARAEDHVVVVEGERFTSLTFVTVYVRNHNIAPHALKFVDTMSLMEMVTAMAQLFANNVDTQCRGSCLQMDRPSNQKAIYSFQLTAPTSLAGAPDLARSSPHLLNAFKNYEAFKGSGSGDSGAVNELMHLLDEKTPAFATKITWLDMAKEAQFLSKTLLDSSKRFLVTLLTFMERQMKKYGAETNLKEVQRWELVHAIVRIVFGVISKARRSCSKITILEAKSATRAPELLWAVLQAHHIQNKFLAQNFKSHPSVAPMLTHFLLDVISFHDDVKPLVKDVASALHKVQQTKRKVDSLENQVKTCSQSYRPMKRG